MKISMILNGKKTEAEIDADMLLIDFVRSQGCYSVKRGCETSNCGLCTVFLEGKPVLSCSVLAARANGCKVDTLEGLQEEAEEFVPLLPDRRRAVRVLQSGDDYECDCAVPGKSGSE